MKTQLTHIRVPVWIKEAARDASNGDARSINDRLIYWMRTGMPLGLSEKYEPRSAYERAAERIESLVTEGRNAVPGIREKCYTEAEAIRERVDAMTVEDAGALS